MLQKNQLLELHITEMTNLGFGVGRAENGQIVFVSGAVTGDLVCARIIRVTKGYSVARTEDVKVPSPCRAEDACFSRGCGGCAFRLVSYERECVCKHEHVMKCLAEEGLSSVKVAPLVSGEKIYGYRNKAQYPVGKDRNGQVFFGFYAPKSHRVIEAAHCPLQPPAFGEILDTLGTFFTKNGTSVYDEETGKGLLRHVYLRTSSVGAVHVCLVINGKKLPNEADLCTLLRENHPYVTGISINVQTDDTNVVCGKEYRILQGELLLQDTLAGVTLSIAPAAFYQVNHEAATLLYEGARRAAGLSGDEILLDLYCGVGSIGLSMAKYVRRVIGIEIVPEAVACAKENARNNCIDNAEFYVGDAGNTAALLAHAEEVRGEKIKPDVVVLDPPRKGCDERLLAFLARLAPKKILYISCNPATLVRDMRVLGQYGYKADFVTPYNLFPRTAHCEAVTLLQKE